MQIPIGIALTPDVRGVVDNQVSPLQPGVVLSIESQLKLRCLYEYLDSCRAALDEIRQDLALQVYEPDGLADLQKASEKLERFCLEADSWGFNSLYEIALGLQMILLNCGGHFHDGSRESLRRGLAMLPALLEQCERDFCWRLAVADLLDYFEQATDGN